MLKVDLHLHTAEDPLDDVLHTAAQLVDRAAALDFDALAITLHDRQLVDPWLSAYARDRGIVLLPGIERTVAGKHVVLINFPQAVEQARSFDDLARLKSRCNGIVIAPHPFFPDRSCLRSRLAANAKLFDAVEWSYFWTRAINFNASAARWANEHGKPLVGNSDLHDLRQLGRTFSRVSAEPAVDAICDAIRAGDVTIETAPVPELELVQVFGGMVWRDVRRGLATRRRRAFDLARPSLRF